MLYVIIVVFKYGVLVMLKRMSFLCIFLYAIVNISFGDEAQECDSNADYKSGCTKKIYYENKVLWKETPYKDGKENGIVRVYYKSGKVKFEIPYKDGKRDGNMKEYDEDGNLK